MPHAPQAKKLVLVLTTSSLVTGANREALKVRVLDKIPCICYLVQFRKDKGKNVSALLDFESEVNAMTPAYVAHLSLKVRITDVDVQKINGSLLATYGIVIAVFQVVDKLGRSWFFQETFLLANISMEVILGMFFLTLSNADVQFAEKELTWKTYTTKETLITTCWVKIIDRKKFAKVALDENIEAFVGHVSSLGPKMSIHLAKEVIVPTKYSNFTDVFSEMSANVLPKQTGENEHTIELKKGKQPPYRSIYSQGPVELKTLKIYIEIILANGFVRILKSPAGALILFVCKPDNSFCLYVNYQKPNNLMIKNWYLLPLISKSLDRLGQAKQFTQLDLTSAYYQIRIKEGEKWKTASRTWYGHFEYQVMPFGLFNAPASFQSYINKILAKKLDIFIIVYLDNIFIYTEDPCQA